VVIVPTCRLVTEVVRLSVDAIVSGVEEISRIDGTEPFNSNVAVVAACEVVRQNRTKNVIISFIFLLLRI
jgi:hypothetical protein